MFPVLRRFAFLIDAEATGFGIAGSVASIAPVTVVVVIFSPNRYGDDRFLFTCEVLKGREWNNSSRFFSRLNNRIAIANAIRRFCLKGVLDFSVICVEKVGIDGELSGFTVELLR